VISKADDQQITISKPILSTRMGTIADFAVKPFSC